MSSRDSSISWVEYFLRIGFFFEQYTMHSNKNIGYFAAIATIVYSF